jgi:hypothetical protein
VISADMVAGPTAAWILTGLSVCSVTASTIGLKIGRRRDVVEVTGADVVAVGHETLEPVQVEVEDLALLVVAVALVVLAAVGDDVQARVSHVLDGQRDGVAVQGAVPETRELGRVDSAEREYLARKELGARVGPHDGGRQQDFLTTDVDHDSSPSGSGFALAFGLGEESLGLSGPVSRGPRGLTRPCHSPVRTFVGRRPDASVHCEAVFRPEHLEHLWMSIALA